MSDGPIAAGENILVYADERATYLHVYRPGGRFECHHGAVDMPEALYWGDVLETMKGVPLAILRPSHAEVLTLLKRRTTVVYPKEAGRILLEMGVRSGGRYGEVGSGSGAMTSILAWMTGPEGRIYSRERVENHFDQACKNIERFGVSDRVDLELRDVARQGWGVDGLDAVFVDVPEPWSIVPAALDALDSGGIWVSLSPTVDQIVRTERALFQAGFARRTMLELFERKWKLFPGRTRPGDRMIGHTAFLLTARRVGDMGFVRREQTRRKRR